MIEVNVLNTCIEEDTSQTSRELAKRIGISHTAILKHFHAIGKVRKNVTKRIFSGSNCNL